MNSCARVMRLTFILVLAALTWADIVYAAVNPKDVKWVIILLMLLGGWLNLNCILLRPREFGSLPFYNVSTHRTYGTFEHEKDLPPPYESLDDDDPEATKVPPDEGVSLERGIDVCTQEVFFERPPSYEVALDLEEEEGATALSPE